MLSSRTDLIIDLIHIGTGILYLDELFKRDDISQINEYAVALGSMWGIHVNGFGGHFTDTV